MLIRRFNRVVSGPRGGRAPFSGSRTLGLNLRGRRREPEPEYDKDVMLKNDV